MKPDIKRKLTHSNPRKITELQLENGRLKQVPIELKDFQRLKFLSLFNNSFTDLPQFFADFEQLENLNLSSNAFILIPEVIKEIKSLKYLSFKGNRLTDLLGLEGLHSQIEKLDLSSNNLEILRFDFSSFNKIREIDLSGNSIKKFPKSVLSCSQLTILKLANNQINEVPLIIGELNKLTVLDLSYNNISELPEEICLLENLRSLNLTGNKITKLPKSFKNLKKLKELNLNGNPIGEVPVEVSNQGLGAVLNYYLHLGKSVRLNEAKLLIVGQGSVGKTYLMNKLINGHSPETVTTEGIDIQKWNLSVTREDKDEKIRLNAWDFGGQEIYHSTHQFFLTKRSLYLFIWEARTDDSLITFDYWLNIIKVLSNSSPVIVVMNKSDERIKEIDEKSLQEKFTNIIGFCSVSALTGNNLDTLKELIAQNVLKLPHIGDKLPKVWSDIRDELEDIDDNYISYEKYIEICNSYGLNKEESRHLSRYFHDLGVFLHFVGNSVLKPIVFLKPEWATNCVYKILDLHEVIKNHGEFNTLLLEEKLCEYSSQQISYVIELMKKFELCFELRKGTYNIPELLRPTEPDIKWKFEKSIGLEYKYDFMPAGIIPRLTVRLKDLIENGEYWKNGIYLKYKNTTIASVIGNVFNRTIRIEVSGDSKAYLLEKIKFEIDTINETLNNPSYDLRINCNCEVCTSSTSPFMFDYDYLLRAKRISVETVQCHTSMINVNVSSLIGPYEVKVHQNTFDFRFNYIDLTEDIIEIASRILERKMTIKLEDLITDHFTDHLRTKGYLVTDQTRSGISNKHAGELDIMVRNPRNMPLAIIEAMKLSSLGKGNTTVIEHLNKLILKYDTNGLPRNFMLIYANSDNFDQLWKNYKEYIADLHLHRLYDGKAELKSYNVNNEITGRSNIRTLVSQHNVNGKINEIYHFVINMR